MKNLKIGKKLFITFGVITVLFCITVAVSLYSLFSTGNNFTVFYEEPFQVTNMASDLRTSLQAVGKNIGYTMMTADPEKTAEYIQNAQDELKNLTDGVDFMKKNFTGNMTPVENFEKAMNETAEERNRVLELALTNQNSEASALYFEKVMPGLVEATGYLAEINDSSMELADTRYQKSMIQKTAVAAVLAALSGAVLILTVLLAVYITRSLTKPIRELDTVANQLAEGNLNISVHYTSRDELGSLAGSMRRMAERISFYMRELTKGMEQLASGDLDVKAREKFLGDFRPVQVSIRKLIDNLNSTLSQISQSADQVAGGSDQVANGAQALSQGATEQASSVEELAATINEISDQVKSNAQSAQQARETADSVSTKLLRSNEQMQEMTRAMDEINVSSNEIGKIIKTIEDIAFQTNILALNAAVEAARAGAAGKGFAVVADEVRSLAGKSSEASKSTTALIESSMKAVENGARIADETAASLLSVVEGTKEITTQITQIADASSEQASSVAQVTQGIDQISNVVQTNSATAQESAAASEELSGQAQILKDLVSRFNLMNSNTAANAAVPSGPAYGVGSLAGPQPEYIKPAAISLQAEKY